MRLTPRERALFDYFAARHGQPLSRPELLANVWGEHYRGGPRTVDIHVCRLRAKLRRTISIETVRRGGYVLRRVSDGPENDAALPHAV